ncbi:hypothetical protein ABFS83_07G107900 [Erythranthe nasuta]
MVMHQQDTLTNSNTADVLRQRRRDLMKRKYAGLSNTEKQEYKEKVMKHRKEKNVLKPPLKRKYNTYQNLSQEEKRNYIDHVTESRRQRQLGRPPSVSSSSSNGVIPPNCITSLTWLLRAQMVPYESKGSLLYDPQCSDMHELKKMPDCSHCGATRFEYEPPTFCCGNGKIKLAHIEVPDELYDLFTSQSEEAIEFRNNIRVFNCIFSFTSFGVNLDKELASARREVYTFRAQGMVYHDLPGLNPNENGPSNFQLYFVDTENEVTNRRNVLQTSTLSGGTVEKLIHVLEINPYAKIFRRLKDYCWVLNTNTQVHVSQTSSKVDS